MNARDLKWHRNFLNIAAEVATWSKDRSTKTGCVIVRDRRMLGSGYNGMTPGIDDDDDANHERPLKYRLVEHAERNAIYQAARYGISTEGATAYITGVSCCDCARAIVQAGVVRVVWPEDNPFEKDEATMARWKESMEASFRIWAAANVEVVRVPSE